MPLGEFIPGGYGVIQVSKEVMRFHEKYYVDGKWKHNANCASVVFHYLDVNKEKS